MSTRIPRIAAVAAALLLAACGGSGGGGAPAGTASPVAAPGLGGTATAGDGADRTSAVPDTWAPPDLYAPLACYGTPGIRRCSRDHYRDAIARDGGTLYGWGDAGMPEVYIANDASKREEAVVRRAVAIINRSLPPDQKLTVSRSTGRISGPELSTGEWSNRLQDGVVWAGFATKPSDDGCGDINATGCGGVHAPPGSHPSVATKGVAHVYDSVQLNPAGQAAVMVHELLHALGIVGHPQEIHTSLMSYEHDDPGVLDNLPLIDAAILYDLNGWGSWNTRTDITRDATIEGLQFGALRIDDLHVIPFVNAGLLYTPDPETLRGTVIYEGIFRGYDGPADTTSDVRIDLHFPRNDGSIDFHQWAKYTNAGWLHDSQPAFSYGLVLREHWFESAGHDGDFDGDGAPDVQGATYRHWSIGDRPEVAAGTLERGTLIGAFGAEAN